MDTISMQKASSANYHFKLVVISFVFLLMCYRFQGDNSYTPSAAHYHHLERLCATKAVAEIYTLSCFSLDLETRDLLELPIELPDDLAVVLHTFSSVFEVLRGLPPPRSQDHSITLQEGVTAIKVKPYRYPFSHKTEIERMLVKMLREGLIQPSTSPFSAFASSQERWDLAFLY